MQLLFVNKLLLLDLIAFIKMILLVERTPLDEKVEWDDFEVYNDPRLSY